MLENRIKKLEKIVRLKDEAQTLVVMFVHERNVFESDAEEKQYISDNMVQKSENNLVAFVDANSELIKEWRNNKYA